MIASQIRGSRPQHMTRTNVYIIFYSTVFLSEPSRSGGEKTGVINRIFFEIFTVSCVCFFKIKYDELCCHEPSRGIVEGQ